MNALAARLRREVDGEVLFDAASRGRYSTDASIYQIQPLGVVVPRSEEAARTALAIAFEQGVPVLPRGAGTSQCGQTVGAALVIDHSKYLNQLLELDLEAGTALVQPGLVLDQLNARLRPHGLWYPVDVSTSAQATLGGMAGNNSCGSRSIAYGNMVHNVLSIDALTATGERWRFGPMGAASTRSISSRSAVATTSGRTRRCGAASSTGRAGCGRRCSGPWPGTSPCWRCRRPGGRWRWTAPTWEIGRASCRERV